ncbi:MAG: histone deacetylase family protein [Oceanipulchritudo sp.]
MPHPVAVFFHPDCLLHDTGHGHPETAARLKCAKSALEKAAFAGQLHWHRPAPVEARWLEGVHTAEYRHFIEEACLQGRHFVDTGDTVVCHDSYHAALLSAGAAVEAVDAVLKEGYRSAFSLTRPPGHHASAETAMGFCLFNNVAIAANYAEGAYGLERICILDWDVHHGNGTQNIFYASPSVLFCSLHQLPLFPHTGEFHETGMGAGKGLTVNCPFPNGAGIDLLLEALEYEVLPKINSFEPQLFLVSAGFDAHRLDPLADLQLESGDFHTLTRWILQQARTHAHGRLVSILEGGYHLDALGESIAEHLRALVEQE